MGVADRRLRRAVGSRSLQTDKSSTRLSKSHHLTLYYDSYIIR